MTALQLLMSSGRVGLISLYSFNLIFPSDLCTTTDHEVTTGTQLHQLSTSFLVTYERRIGEERNKSNLFCEGKGVGERGDALLISMQILNSSLCDTKDVLDLRKDIKSNTCNRFSSLPFSTMAAGYILILTPKYLKEERKSGENN